MIMTDQTKRFRILTLDGGGSKGVYTLGVLLEVEKIVGKPLAQCFDLIYGTSTGSIIASALSLGMSVSDILTFYRSRVPLIMKRFRRHSRSTGLSSALTEVLGERKFDSCVTDLGVVTTNFDDKRVMIFKSSVDIAHGMKASFVPGFGCTIADAVEASCSAYPFFPIKIIKTENQGVVRLVDGGFVANNPSILAYIDALNAKEIASDQIDVLSIGTGRFPERIPKEAILQGVWLIPARELISMQLDANANSIAKTFEILSKGAKIVRINDSFSEPELASSLFEYDLERLDRLSSKGRESFSRCEGAVASLLGVSTR
jgi:uncharacterized protein